MCVCDDDGQKAAFYNILVHSLSFYMEGRKEGGEKGHLWRERVGM